MNHISPILVVLIGIHYWRYHIFRQTHLENPWSVQIPTPVTLAPHHALTFAALTLGALRHSGRVPGVSSDWSIGGVKRWHRVSCRLGKPRFCTCVFFYSFFLDNLPDILCLEPIYWWLDSLTLWSFYSKCLCTNGGMQYLTQRQTMI